MGVISNDEMEEARRKLGVDRALHSDPLTNYVALTLKTFAAHLEDALREEGVDPETARRILHRVVWGGMPHAVDATVRMDLLAERVQQARIEPPYPVKLSPAWQTSEPIE